MKSRDELVNNYVLEMVEGMDMDTLVSYAIDALRHDVELWTDEELFKEVTEYYPHLLEEAR